jgi:4a-hydroxytetrahydrobiopterin dehydratase
MTRISPVQFHEAVGLGEWRVLGEGACAYFRTDSFADSARFVQALAELGADDHPPAVDVRPDGVTIRLITVTPDLYGITESDSEVAQQISAVARKLDLAAEPSRLQNIQISIDALAAPKVLPFWRAVLGYADRPDSAEDLIDPRGRGPLAYFQQMDAPRPQRNRIHFDVWVAHDQAEARVAAALDAGGRLVTDAYAPGWWVVADEEGNEACVCTWQSHSG